MEYQIGTLAIHAGQVPDPTTGAIMTPIYQTSTYVQESPGKHHGFEYARTQNPTRFALEANLAALEAGNWGYCFGSGMAAIDAIAKTLLPGQEVVATNDLYGGTYRIFSKIFANYGIVFHFIDLSDLEALKATINDKTAMVWVETPTNPTLKILDIRGIKAVIGDRAIKLVVDNTFATPYLQRPLLLGADIVVHSATKYLGGHSDVILGAVVGLDPEVGAQIQFIQNSTGAVCGPMDAWLVLRGIKTLHVRMDRHCHNGKIIAKHLVGHSHVGKVHYPGLKDHPGHGIAAEQMMDFGGMLSFELKDQSVEAAIRVLEAFKVFSLAESLGGVESLVGHPATMTHASIPREQRLATGLTDGLIRLSVGIEDVEDLITDLDQALNMV